MSQTFFSPHLFRKDVRFLPGHEPRKPKVILSRQAYSMIWLYVHLARQEVGWLGTASETADGDFRIEKVMLIDQEVTGVETQLSIDGLTEFGMELIDKGDAGIEEWNKLRFWGHSHVHMGTSPSHTDESTMLTFQHPTFGHPWFIRGIFNKRGRAEFTLFMYDQGLKFEDVEWQVEGLSEKEQTEQIALEDTTDKSESAAEAALDSAAEKQEVRSKHPLSPDLTHEIIAAAKTEFAQKVRERQYFYRPFGQFGALLGSPDQQRSPGEDTPTSTTSVFGGIGVLLVPGKIDNQQTVVESVAKGGPAEKAGIKPGDVLLIIDGRELRIFPGAPDKLKGEVGTTVSVTVDRRGEIFEFTVTREEIGNVTPVVGDDAVNDCAPKQPSAKARPTLWDRIFFNESSQRTDNRSDNRKE